MGFNSGFKGLNERSLTLCMTDSFSFHGYLHSVFSSPFRTYILKPVNVFQTYYCNSHTVQLCLTYIQQTFIESDSMAISSWIHNSSWNCYCVRASTPGL